MEQVKQMPSSVFPDGNYQRVETKQVMIPTSALIILLIVIFVLLKKFLYIPDGDRAGK